jgi:hypothetical protein
VLLAERCGCVCCAATPDLSPLCIAFKVLLGDSPRVAAVFERVF